MKNKILSCLCLAMSLMFSVGCESVAPYPKPNENSSRALLILCIDDSLGNNALENTAFEPEEEKDTTLSLKAKIYHDNAPLNSYFELTKKNDIYKVKPWNQKNILFFFHDSTAYKNSWTGSFQRTYRLGVRIPKLFSDNKYHFFDLSYLYEKGKVKLLSATFEGEKVKVKNYPPVEDKLSFTRGEDIMYLTYRPKR